MEARKQFKVLLPVQGWVLTWKKVDSVKKAKARLVAKGYQDPDLRPGNVDTAGCVIRRSSYLQVTSLRALKKWPLWNPDIKNAFPQADGFDREVYRRAPREWNPRDTRRVWKPGTPAHGLQDAPAVCYQPCVESVGIVAQRGPLF